MGLIAKNNQDAVVTRKTPRPILNEQQEQAVNHKWGACFVSAVPGSGKTRVITERAARLIEGGISPEKILCITFTNKAAQEMKQRLVGIIGEVANDVYVSTFHAMSLNILRKFGKSIGYTENITILDDEDQISLMSQCARQMGDDLSKDSIKSILYTCNNSRENLLKGNFFDASFNSSENANIANEYIKRMRANNQTDFSGILSETIRLLESDKQVCQRLTRRFDWLQIDETQDTNYAQFRIIDLIGSHGNIFIVGDIDQCVYTFRGARYENIEDFIKNYKATVIELPLNYRSTPEIVKAASNLIKANKGRGKSDIKTVNVSGSAVKCFSAETPDHEAMMIASSVEKLVHSEGYKYEQFAVLYRANAMSRALETAFMNRGVPYQVIGGFSFFKREEIKDALAMLRFSVNPFDSTALARFINKPSYSLGQVTLGKIENYAAQKNVDLVSALLDVDSYLTSSTPKSEKVKDRAKLIGRVFSKNRSGQDIGSIIDGIVKDLDYEKWIEDNYKEDASDRKSTLDELINSASRASKQSSISDYLNKIALMTTADKSSQAGAVTLMTIHASKGLEFPVVFLPRLEEGKLPHTRSSCGEDGVEEERRLCYVAMTRAEKILVTSYSKQEKIRSGKFLRTINNRPSRFLFESNILKENNND